MELLKTMGKRIVKYQRRKDRSDDVDIQSSNEGYAEMQLHKLGPQRPRPIRGIMQLWPSAVKQGRVR
jgi:hypothetical protein